MTGLAIFPNGRSAFPSPAAQFQLALALSQLPANWRIYIPGLGARQGRSDQRWQTLGHGNGREQQWLDKENMPEAAAKCWRPHTGTVSC